MPLTLTHPDLQRNASFIDGQLLPATGRTLDITDPATGALIAQVPDSGADEARAATDAEHAAFPGWRVMPSNQRAQILKRWNDLVMAHQDELGRLIMCEQGEPLAEGKGVLFASAARRLAANFIDTVQVPAPASRAATESAT